MRPRAELGSVAISPAAAPARLATKRQQTLIILSRYLELPVAAIGAQIQHDRATTDRTVLGVLLVATAQIEQRFDHFTTVWTLVWLRFQHRHFLVAIIAV